MLKAIINVVTNELHPEVNIAIFEGQCSMVSLLGECDGSIGDFSVHILKLVVEFDVQ